MLPRIIIQFIEPSPLPTAGFVLSYRPKGSLAPYFSSTQTTGSPMVVTQHLLNNVDYEGTLGAVCASAGSALAFSTSNYHNAVGNVIVTALDAAIATSPALSVTNITFNDATLLPLEIPFPLVPTNTAAFVCPSQGFNSVIVSFRAPSGYIIFTDSLGVITRTNINTTQSILFTGTINSTAGYSVQAFLSHV